MPMWDERVRDGPIVDKPAAVAKAPFSQKEERFQRVDIRAVTKRNLLTLAKVSIAGIISDIIVLAGGISSRGLHDGGRWWTREIKSLLQHPRSSYSPPHPPPALNILRSYVTRSIPRCSKGDTDFTTNRLHAARLVPPDPQHGPG